MRGRKIFRKECILKHSKYQEQDTFNLQPSTFNLQPATCNLEPSTFNLQPATCNLEPSSLTIFLYQLNPGYLNNWYTVPLKSFLPQLLALPRIPVLLYAYNC